MDDMPGNPNVVIRQNISIYHITFSQALLKKKEIKCGHATAVVRFNNLVRIGGVSELSKVLSVGNKLVLTHEFT